MGGMFGESKYDILRKIPATLKPKTIVIDRDATPKIVMDEMMANGYRFPVIFKPDLGERGLMVKRVNNEGDIVQYLKKVKVRFLVQELVDLPLEFGVFYSRRPSEAKGKVTSVVMKEMLFVIGDGKATLRDLILKKPRAKLQFEKLKETYQNRLDEIIPGGKKVELVSIGNHALGTKFLNGNHLITDKLSATFDSISKSIDGFYFGRYDLRCASVEDLENGIIKIVELNGCGAEPAHIYDPSFRILRAFQVLHRHWRTIFEISRENHKRGIPFISLQEARKYYRNFKDATR